MATDRYSKMELWELENEIRNRKLEIPEEISSTTSPVDRREKMRRFLRKDDEVNQERRKKRLIFAGIANIALVIVLLALVILFATNAFKSSQTPATIPTAPSPIVENKPTATFVFPETATAVATQTPNVVVTATPQETSVVTAEPQETAVQTVARVVTVDAGEVQFPGFSVTGVDTVDPKVVLFANGPDTFGNSFKNVTGLGSQMMFAEPGSILYGSDEPASIVKTNPHGAYINPLYQIPLVTDSASVEVGEGGFVLATAASMTVDVGKFQVRLDGTDQHMWVFAVRGYFADAQVPDRNATARFSAYVAGHAQVMKYPPGAYISEGQFLQIVATGHTNAYTSAAGEAVTVTSRNCGDYGCRGVSVFMLDLNTGAWVVIHQDGLTGAWTFVSSNWLSQ